jgi:hypothetical protein
MSLDDARNIDAYPVAFHTALRLALNGDRVVMMEEDEHKLKSLRRSFRAFAAVAKYNPRYRQALQGKRICTKQGVIDSSLVLMVFIQPELDRLSAYDVKRLLNRAKLLPK